jgi:2-methylisocitrate lyase-like PEP mutase family enzyme
LPKERLVELGYQLILYPLAALLAAARAMELVCRKLRQDARPPHSKAN